MVIPATSTEYLHVPVTATPGAVALTGVPVKIAILSAGIRGNPEAADWHAATWSDATTARILIGPDGGAVTLAVGDYRVWITFDPPGAENIVRIAGHLGVT